MTSKLYPDISVIIPSQNGEQHLINLLQSLEKQTHQPLEVIIIDTSINHFTQELVYEISSQYPFPVTCHQVSSAYPGHARNKGVLFAKGSWIAFLDIRTTPVADWLEQGVQCIHHQNVKFVKGLMIARANTTFQKLLKATTYGNIATSTIPGSLILKTAFLETGGFPSDMRAGEDIEWLRLLSHRQQVTTGNFTAPCIEYRGFPQSYWQAIKKWTTYSFANAKADIYKERKLIYLILLVILLTVPVYHWNAIVAQWNEEDSFYVPNITKLFLATITTMYVVYRGLIKPAQSKEPLDYLLPWRWLTIGFLGLSLDIAKAPGLVYGGILLLVKPQPR